MKRGFCGECLEFGGEGVYGNGLCMLDDGLNTVRHCGERGCADFNPRDRAKFRDDDEL